MSEALLPRVLCTREYLLTVHMWDMSTVNYVHSMASTQAIIELYIIACILGIHFDCILGWSKQHRQRVYGSVGPSVYITGCCIP